jgi:hypothetical protein
MWRFVTVLVLALTGIVWFAVSDGYVLRCASIAGFVTAAILPAVMNPTRHWGRAFFLCFDFVYAAACVGAWLAALVVPTPRLEVLTAGLVPGLLFGTMASLGVGRSGLAEFGR